LGNFIQTSATLQVTREVHTDTFQKRDVDGCPNPCEVLVKLLNICMHQELLHLRGLYLRVLGYEVVDTLGPASAMALLRSAGEFEMVILCHTVPPSDKLLIESLIRNTCAEARTLELYLGEPPVTGGMKVEATTEFQRLMKMMARLNLGEPANGAEYPNDIGQRRLQSVN
jgi:hypothetical protein